MTDNILSTNIDSVNTPLKNTQPSTNTLITNNPSNNIPDNIPDNIKSVNSIINNNQSNNTDKCDTIRQSLMSHNVDVKKYDLCYTKSLSIHTDAECTLCRHDKETKSFICRPNMVDEEVISVKDFCKPLNKFDKTQINNVYYQDVIDICMKYKHKLKR